MCKSFHLIHYWVKLCRRSINFWRLLPYGGHESVTVTDWFPVLTVAGSETVKFIETHIIRMEQTFWTEMEKELYSVSAVRTANMFCYLY